MCAIFEAPSAKIVFFRKTFTNGYAFKTTHRLTFKNYAKAKLFLAASFPSLSKAVIMKHLIIRVLYIQ